MNETEKQIQPQQPNWLQSLSSDLSDKAGCEITQDGIVLCLPEDIETNDILQIAERLSMMNDQFGVMGGILQYNIGRMILELASRDPARSDPVQLVDQYDLPARLNRSAKTILNWVHTAQTVPAFIIPENGLTWSQIYEVSGNPPAGKTPQEWNEARKEILEEAASDPDEKGSKWVRDKVSSIRPKRGGSDRFSNMDLFIQYVNLNRKIVSLDEDWFLANGYASGTNTAQDKLHSIELELISRRAIAPDAMDDELPWEDGE